MIEFPALLDRQSGVLQIEWHQAAFISEENKELFHIPYNELELSLSGENSNQYIIIHRRYPERIITVQDIKAIELLASYGVNSAKQVLKNSKNKNRLRWIAWSLPLGGLLFFILLFPLVLAFLPLSTMNALISPQQEKKIGLWIAKMNGPIEKENENGAIKNISLQSVKSLAEIIKQNSSELQEIDYEFYVSPNKESNAFATLGNIIVIHQGLLDEAETPEEIAGILAHEMAHIERGHTKKALYKQAGLLVGLGFIGLIAGPDIAALIGKGADLVSMQYSQIDEMAADKQAFYFLKNSQISNQGLISFFARKEKQNLLGGAAKALSFLSTHPLSSERIAQQQALAAMDQIKTRKDLKLSLKDFKSPQEISK